MRSLHVWTVWDAVSAISLRTTQPNPIYPFALFLARSAVHLQLTRHSDQCFEIAVPPALATRLVAPVPNWEGEFLAIGLTHVLGQENEMRFWGWTYRVASAGRIETQVTDGLGNRLNCDPDGWIEWPNQRQDFAGLVAAPDIVFLDFHGLLVEG